MTEPSWCDTCPKPGNCCKTLSLYGALTPETKTIENQNVFPDTPDAKEVAIKAMAEQGAPFVPNEIIWTGNVDGAPHVMFNYTCPKLLSNGRCGDYENRPFACSDFKPGTDKLCVFTKEHVLREEHGGPQAAPDPESETKEKTND